MLTTRRGAIALAATLLAVLALATAPACAAEGSFDRTLTVTGPVSLEVSTGSGSIQVRPGGSGQVRVHAEIKARRGWGGPRAAEKVRQLEAHPPIEQDGNNIRIGHIEDRELSRNVSISYEVETPRQTELRSQTGSGSQTVSGLQGPVKAETGSGSVSVSEIGSEVRAGTGSGDVTLESISGAATASTGSGSIHARGIAGGFTGSTGSGNVRLEQTAPGRVKVTTGSGTIELAGVRGSLRVETGSGAITADGQIAGDWKLESGSGGIRVRLPSDAAFDLRAHTSSGHISTEHPVTLQGTLSRSDWRGRVRGGGYLLDVQTGSGDIHIE